MVDQKTIDKAIRMLLEAAPRGSEVILFGSYVQGTAGDASDVDFLVVEPTVLSRHQETVRLRQVLRSLRIPVDVLVVSRESFESWKDQPNNVVSEAAKRGRAFTNAA